MSIKDELEALTDKLRGIRAKPHDGNGHAFHRGKSRLSAIEREHAKQLLKDAAPKETGK